MCDLSDEEFEEYLRWAEAAAAPLDSLAVRPRKARSELDRPAPAPAVVTA